VKGNRISSTSVAVVPAILYLDENHGLFILHDQVNLAEATGEVPL
jgi:hypothetical protein